MPHKPKTKMNTNTNEKTVRPEIGNHETAVFLSLDENQVRSVKDQNKSGACSGSAENCQRSSPGCQSVNNPDGQSAPCSSTAGEVEKLSSRKGQQPKTKNPANTGVLVKGKLTVAQLNLHHAKGATANLQRHLDQLGPMTIGLIQEPWHFKGRVRGLNSPDRQLFAATVPADIAPRAVISCTKDLNPLFVPQLSNRDLAVVQITVKIPGKRPMPVTVASVYLAGDELIPQEALKEIAEFCQQTSSELILGGDVNAHHVIWASTDTNQRGEELLAVILKHNWEILNKGECPTFVTSNRSEVLDITICSANIRPYMADWAVSEKASLSDHRMIEFCMRKAKVDQKWTRRVKATNWSQYVEHLSQALPEIQYPTDETQVECYSQELTTAIVDAFHSSCPVKKQTGRKAPPWWNQKTRGELYERKVNANSTFQKYLSDKTPQNWEVARSASRLYSNCIRKAKRKTWRQFCADVKTVPESGRLAKILKSGPPVSMGLLKLPNGKMTTTAEETVQHLLQVHFPNCKVDGVASENRYTPTQQCVGLASRVVTEHAVRGAVKSLSPYKSPGPDEVHPVLLQKGLEALLPHLVQLYRASLKLGYIPHQWRLARVVFIPKPGKASYDTAKSWRPISLTSFMLKVAEKLVDRHLKMRQLRVHPLHPNQHAYQAGKSTETALNGFLSKVQDSLDHGQYALACFLDIQGAFDNAQFEDILSALRDREIEPSVINWVTNTLKQRTVTATAGTVTCSALTTQGTAQGGVLSALWWVLVVDDLIRQLNANGYFTIGYSDDITILLRGPDLGTLCEMMQLALKIVSSWCNRTKMTMSAEKTQLMLFTRKYKVTGWKTVRLNGVTLQSVDMVKYLGLYLDSKLLWNEHIRRKSDAAHRMLWQCRQAMRNTWGVNSKVARWIYECVIKPAIVYGGIFWAEAACKTRPLQQLNKVQRLACVMILSALKTTPLIPMEILCGILPIELYIKYRARCTAYRLQAMNLGPGKGHSLTGYRCSFRDIQSLQCVARDSDSCPSWLTPTPMYQLVESTEEVEFTGRYIGCTTLGVINPGKDPPTTNKVYGAYWTTVGYHKIFELQRYCTSWQAEQYSIIQLCKMLLTECPSTVRISLSNKAYWLSLQKYKVAAKQLKILLSLLNQVSIRHSLMLSYTDGTDVSFGTLRGLICEYQESEKANQKTGKASVGALLNWAKHMLYTDIWEEQANRWAGDRKHRQSHLFIGAVLPSNQDIQWLLSLPRPQLYGLIGVVTGHNALNRHLYIMGVSETEICQKCADNVPENSEHFICHCSQYTHLRSEIFGMSNISLNMLKNNWPMLLQFIIHSKRFDFLQ